MTSGVGRFGERVQLVRRSARWERVRSRGPHYLFLAATVVVSLVGARELISPDGSAAPSSRLGGVDHASEDFAQRFARAYLSHDAARPAARERALRGLVPDDLSLDAGLIPRGSQQVLWTEVAQNQEAIAGGRVIVIATGVSTQPEPFYLGVPVYRAADGAVGLADYPSLVGPPAISRAEFAEPDEVEEAPIVAVARRVVANYLALERQNLAADLAPEAEVSLPTRELGLRSVEDVVWADGVGSSAVLVTVVARDAERLTWTLTYELGITQRAGRPYVTFVETVPTAS
ncbi:MAG: hypothetical protein GEU88_10175 [Solirubrobacterales bacterium]|nr:hypothetical protein [Solirubrobacterales bacterium]